MTTRGSVEIETRDGVVVARLAGELDLSNVESVQATITRQVGPHTRGLVLDLMGVTFFDSTGVRMVFELARRLADRQRGVRLVLDDEAVIGRVVALTRLDEVAAVEPDLETAIRAFGAAGSDGRPGPDPEPG